MLTFAAHSQSYGHLISVEDDSAQVTSRWHLSPNLASGLSTTANARGACIPISSIVIFTSSSLLGRFGQPSSSSNYFLHHRFSWIYWSAFMKRSATRKYLFREVAAPAPAVVVATPTLDCPSLHFFHWQYYGGRWRCHCHQIVIVPIYYS